ncbi:hypothetical protein [Spiroplasma culicicola]|uniref:Uncharacterized protein n=1 Tax=Spiroplasma culicicola AES-1 TaxID=1276246 RepID=W6A755_9MOLU|nr:hypothetical protein [Spiroplasma culicicola]AHI52973.1 hypothetical protein SCULI_v1c06320 [Spiroplasma culicicola AES-1]
MIKLLALFGSASLSTAGVAPIIENYQPKTEIIEIYAEETGYEINMVGPGNDLNSTLITQVYDSLKEKTVGLQPWEWEFNEAVKFCVELDGKKESFESWDYTGTFKNIVTNDQIKVEKETYKHFKYPGEVNYDMVWDLRGQKNGSVWVSGFSFPRYLSQEEIENATFTIETSIYINK